MAETLDANARHAGFDGADSVSKSGSGADAKDSSDVEGLDAKGEGFVAVWGVDVEGFGGGGWRGRARLA